MQNSFFNSENLKLIEKIIFQYLWSKKPDKIRCFERISRFNLKKPKFLGGLNIPDITCVDKSFKTLHLIKLTEPDCTHCLKDIYTNFYKLAEVDLFTNMSYSDPFIVVATSGLHAMGNFLMSEIKEAGEQRIHAKYYNVLASQSLFNLLMLISPGLIQTSYARNISRSFGIVTVKEFLNEYNFPSSENHIEMIRFIFNSNTIFTKLNERVNLASDCFRNGFFYTINQLYPSKTLKSNILSSFFLQIKYPRLLCDIENPDTINSFKKINSIIHPREQEIEFFHRHNVLLNNSALFNMNLLQIAPFAIHYKTTNTSLIRASMPSPHTESQLNTFLIFLTNPLLCSITQRL